MSQLPTESTRQNHNAPRRVLQCQLNKGKIGPLGEQSIANRIMRRHMRRHMPRTILKDHMCCFAEVYA